MISAEANLRHLKTLVGADVDFHDDQEDAINSCLEKGSRTLLVQKNQVGGNQRSILLQQSPLKTHKER